MPPGSEAAGEEVYCGAVTVKEYMVCTDPLTLTITSKAEPNGPLKNTVRSQAPDSPTVNSCVVLYGLLILITAPAGAVPHRLSNGSGSLHSLNAWLTVTSVAPPAYQEVKL